MITDLTPYRKYVDQFDLTEEQKLELVNVVWTMVDIIFDQHLRVTDLTQKLPSNGKVGQAESNLS